MKSTAPFGVTFDIGGLLSRTAQVLRDDPLRFSLLTVVPALVCIALVTTAAIVGASMSGLSLAGIEELQAALAAGSLPGMANAATKFGSMLFPVFISVGIACLVCSVIALVVQSAVYVATEEVIRGGPRRSAWQALGAGLVRVPALFAVGVVQLLVFFACSAPVLALANAAATEGSWALGLAAIPVATVLFCVDAFLMLRLMLALVATVVDKLGPGAAIARGWQISRGSMLDYLVATLLMIIANTGLSVLASVVMVVPVLGWLAGAFITLVSMVAPSVWWVLAYAGLSDRVGHRRA